MTLLRSAIEGLPLLHRGKVRETYAVGSDQLLLVATDRLSAFDVVFDQPIPDKGRLLTQLSAWWFRRLADLGATHFISIEPSDLPEQARAPELTGRSTLARRAVRIDAECVVRGYLAGSGWAEYRASGLVGGHQLPGGLREADRLPEPIFTPTTKAAEGHDAPLTAEQAGALVGDERFAELERISIELYTTAAEALLEKGIVIADTKFELGLADDGTVVLGDEIFTPDSSRF